jgi:hypothetical protein
MKIQCDHLFSLADLCPGARASARFNVQTDEAPDHSSPLELRALRRRERRAPRRNESGMATVIFIALLAIMMILVTAESSELIRLHREIKLLEQQQIKRLNGPPTNTIPTAITEAK